MPEGAGCVVGCKATPCGTILPGGGLGAVAASAESGEVSMRTLRTASGASESVLCSGSLTRHLIQRLLMSLTLTLPSSSSFFLTSVTWSLVPLTSSKGRQSSDFNGAPSTISCFSPAQYSQVTSCVRDRSG